MTKQEIRKHPSTKVEQKLDQWLNNLNDKTPNSRHHQLEALWVYANIGIHKEDLVTELINCNVPEARAAAARQIRHWPKNMIDSAEKLIAKCSKDNDEIVKLEAAITCSWLGTQKSFNTLLELGENDMGKHLNYAVTTALGSESINGIGANKIKPLWYSSPSKKRNQPTQEKQHEMQVKPTLINKKG